MGAAAITACSALPHNDVLIFGTETTVAVDVGSSATNGGTPEITIGYKREEAVWMPLLANGRHSRSPPTTGTMYTANGADGKEKDAYSVFASFGAELEGGTGEAKVGLAQFFATGIAAQRLANNPIAALALAVKPDDTGEEEAKAAAAAVGLSPEDQKVLSDFKTRGEMLDLSAYNLSSCLERKGTDLMDSFATTDPNVTQSIRDEFVSSMKTNNDANARADVMREFYFLNADVDAFISKNC